MTDLEKAQKEYIDLLENHVPWRDRLLYYEHDSDIARQMAYNSYLLLESYKLKDKIKECEK